MSSLPVKLQRRSQHSWKWLIPLLLCVIFSCDPDTSPPAPDSESVSGSATVPQPAFDGTIVAVGDSLTAGYGLDEKDAYPALLQQRLTDAGYAFQVINAGISGETSSGTRSRLDWVLTLKPDIVILETGANDGMRGIDPDLIRDNLRGIVQTLQQRGVTVILAGMQMFGNLGDTYTERFKQIYPQLARDENIILFPFFLEGVGGEAQLNQADGIHPTPEGYQKIVANLFPFVLDAIAKSRPTLPNS